LSYKADVDDLRESPAIEVAQLLARLGGQVEAYEPNRPDGMVPGVKTAASLTDALAEAELVLLLVGHTVFKSLHPEDLAGMTSARIIVDAVGAWAPETWQTAGFTLYRLGASKAQPLA
jgi:UDP-N-acetyl-D-mannosaminuronic acid dehydrogenase